MKSNAILSHLRSRIIQGEFKPGERLPHRSVLLEEYSISSGAFQKCINQLVKWKFLESRGVKGVCVTANPPHLSHYALLLPGPESKDSLLFSINHAVAAYSDAHPEIRFKPYWVGLGDNPNWDAWEEFVADAERGLLAGAITLFMAPPQRVQRRIADFPLVVVCRSRLDSPHPYPEIQFDTVDLFRRQLAQLKERGCRNVAALFFGSLRISEWPEIIHVAEESGLHCPQSWMQGILLKDVRSVFHDNLLDLLLAPPGGMVPDGLAILNENFLPLVMRALSRNRRVPGRDIHIVSHGNYPTASPREGGIDYIGYSGDAALQEALRLLDDWSAGKLADKQFTTQIPCSEITRAR